MDSRNKQIKRIVNNAIVLALYVVLSFVSYPIAYSNLQFRISEILVLLCFFNRDYVISLTLGCFLVNIASPFGPWDLLIGTSATLIACLLISFSKHLGISLLFPIISNSFLVGIEYHLISSSPLPYWYSVGIIALGETAVLIVGYILFMIIFKRKGMKEVINANRNLDFKW